MSIRAVKMLSSSLVILMLGAVTLSASAAATPGHSWRESHPRRAEVNARLVHQRARIREEVREGDLTRVQGRALASQDRAIRQQERQMAAAQGGHITAAQQRELNREENVVSRQIPR